MLEASLLRFALSEHFLNVDSLLSPPGGGEAASKKKLPPIKPGDDRVEKEIDKKPLPFCIDDIDSVKSNWQGLLELVTKKLGKGTAGLLSRALPTGFEGGVLILTFSSFAGVSKKMCESNGRSGQIEVLLQEAFGTEVKLKLELAADEGQPTDLSQAVTGSQKRNWIMRDPAVKTILRELGATVTGIEEKN